MKCNINIFNKVFLFSYLIKKFCRCPGNVSTVLKIGPLHIKLNNVYFIEHGAYKIWSIRGTDALSCAASNFFIISLAHPYILRSVNQNRMMRIEDVTKITYVYTYNKHCLLPWELSWQTCLWAWKLHSQWTQWKWMILTWKLRLCLSFAIHIICLDGDLQLYSQRLSRF